MEESRQRLFTVPIVKFIFFIFFLVIFYSSNIHAKDEQVNLSATSQPPIVMGYYSQWSIYSPNVHILDLPLQLMTHLVYQSAYLNKKGEIEVGDAFADIEHLYPNTNLEQEVILGSFGQLIKIKHQHPQLANIISIGGWGRSEYFSSVSSTTKGREIIAKSAIDFMLKYQFDGIEIDWQFPIHKPQSLKENLIANQETDPVNLALLLAEIKQQLSFLSKVYWLQVSIAPYSLEDDWQTSLLSESVDLVILDVSQIAGDESSKTSHLSPLFLQSDDESISGLIARLNEFSIDNEKIVIALPSYAIGWEGVNADNQGLHQSAKKLSWGSWDSEVAGATGLYTRKSLSYILALGTYQQYWDDFSKSSYLFNPERFGGHFIAFESDRSVANKVAYAKQQNLAGVAIRQLHNGDFVLVSTFFHYHFFQGMYYKSIVLWQEHKNILIPVFQFIIILIIIFISTLYLMNKRNRVNVEERRQLLLLQKNLQNLEWPLLNLLMLSPELLKKNLLDSASIDQMMMLSSQLLKPISHVLTETKLNRSLGQQVAQVVSLDDLLVTIDRFIFINRQCRIKWSHATPCQLFIDHSQVQQFLLNLCIFCCDSAQEKSDLEVEIIENESYVDLIVRYLTQNHQIVLNHIQLKPLFAQANILGIQLKTLSGDTDIFQVQIPTSKYSHGLFKPTTVSFFTYQEQGSRSLANISPEISSIEEKNTSIETLEHKNNANSIIDNITLFNLSSTPNKDIFKGLEQACRFFAEYLKNDSKINIYQNEQLITKLGDASLVENHKKIIKTEELSIEIFTKTALDYDDEQLIKVLISQTQMIQNALKALVKEPSTLAELHELTQYKERIKYLKADSGYTGIYVQSIKEPRYISMRLRTIKLYFDDSALIQVHRSYLVNPKKVSHIEHISKLKFKIVIGAEKLPVSRTYIPLLKEIHPEWF